MSWLEEIISRILGLYSSILVPEEPRVEFLRGTGAVSRRYTASCQDALRRARAEIPRARDALARLRSKGRKSGMTPGEMRRFMKRQGIEGLGLKLSRTDAYVDALQKGVGN